MNHRNVCFHITSYRLRQMEYCFFSMFSLLLRQGLYIRTAFGLRLKSSSPQCYCSEDLAQNTLAVITSKFPDF